MMQKIDYFIRESIIEDAEHIASIEKDCFSSPWSFNQVADEIKKDNVIFLSAVSAIRIN